MAKLASRALAEELVYVWEGTDRRGKRVRGELRSPTDSLVRAELRRQGITPLRVKRKPKPLLSMASRIRPRDLMLFSRQLHTMIAAGVPLVQSLDTIGNGIRNTRLRDIVRAVKVDVEGGTPLAAALGKHPRQFDELYRSLVHAGEEAGALERMLDKIAVYQEKSETLRAKVRKALFYPAIVLFVAVLVTAFILIFVIPQFESLFQGFGADLPAFTRFVIGVSQLVQAWWWAMLGGLTFAVLLGVGSHRRSPRVREWFDRLTLRLPVIGNIVRLAANARFARTLATMFGGGVPLIEAMRAVAGATGNVVFERAVLEMRDAVSTGQQLHFAMRQTALFPDMVVQMVAIGEEAGSLAEMLAKVADFYEEELDSTISTLTTLIEPAVMVILAVLVGSLVVAMYLPIFKLGSVV